MEFYASSEGATDLRQLLGYVVLDTRSAREKAPGTEVGLSHCWREVGVWVERVCCGVIGGSGSHAIRGGSLVSGWGWGWGQVGCRGMWGDKYVSE